jgi:hypothetical protein
LLQNIEIPEIIDMNWPQLIADLMAAKVTQVTLAERLGISQGHVSDLRVGRIAQPSYELGAALLSLHSEVIGKKQSMVSPSAEVSADVGTCHNP